MNLILRIPDDIAARLGAKGEELERQTLEALVLEKFRAGLLTKEELARALGLQGCDQIDGFLKSHDVFEPYTISDVHHDVTTLKRHGF